MEILNKYFEEITKILAWAQDNKYISEEALKILHNEFLEAKEELEK